MEALMPTSRLNHSSSGVDDDDDDGDEESRNKRNDLEANRLLNPVFRYVLACWTSSLNGPYLPLYNSEQDGLSFNRLQNALVGYSGPTLLVVTAGGNMFGAFTSSKWREAKYFYGTSETFLYALRPKTRVYRPTLRNESYQYCNSAARSRGYDQQAHGLGFGGTVHRPRLFISEAFEDCNADKQDLTFDNGPLMLWTCDDDDNAGGPGNSSSSSKFSPDSLQVWAVGGQAVVEAALHERGHHRDVVEQGIRRARKVDKAQFLDDLRSGTIDSKAFAHRQQIDGRADQDVADRVQKEREATRQKNLF
jgi:TLD